MLQIHEICMLWLQMCLFLIIGCCFFYFYDVFRIICDYICLQLLDIDFSYSLFLGCIYSLFVYIFIFLKKHEDLQVTVHLFSYTGFIYFDLQEEHSLHDAAASKSHGDFSAPTKSQQKTQGHQGHLLTLETWQKNQNRRGE